MPKTIETFGSPNTGFLIPNEKRGVFLRSGLGDLEASSDETKSFINIGQSSWKAFDGELDCRSIEIEKVQIVINWVVVDSRGVGV